MSDLRDAVTDGEDLQKNADDELRANNTGWFARIYLALGTINPAYYKVVQFPHGAGLYKKTPKSGRMLDDQWTLVRFMSGEGINPNFLYKDAAEKSAISAANKVEIGISILAPGADAEEYFREGSYVAGAASFTADVLGTVFAVGKIAKLRKIAKATSGVAKTADNLRDVGTAASKAKSFTDKQLFGIMAVVKSMEASSTAIEAGKAAISGDSSYARHKAWKALFAAMGVNFGDFAKAASKASKVIDDLPAPKAMVDAVLSNQEDFAKLKKAESLGEISPQDLERLKELENAGQKALERVKIKDVADDIAVAPSSGGVLRRSVAGATGASDASLQPVKIIDGLTGYTSQEIRSRLDCDRAMFE